MMVDGKCSRTVLAETLPSTAHPSSSAFDSVTRLGKPYKGIIRSLQKTGCSHVLDLYFQGLTSRRGQFRYDEELYELQVLLVHFLKWKDFCDIYPPFEDLPFRIDFWPTRESILIGMIMISWSTV